MLVTKASTERLFFFMNILWMSEKLVHVLRFESPELTLNTLALICWECYVVKKHLKEDKAPPKNISDVVVCETSVDLETIVMELISLE
jgi:hypothetical protein